MSATGLSDRPAKEGATLMFLLVDELPSPSETGLFFLFFDLTRSIIDAGVVIDQFIPRTGSPLAKWVGFASHQFVEGIALAEREGKNAKFRIPKSSKDTVDLNF